MTLPFRKIEIGQTSPADLFFTTSIKWVPSRMAMPSKLVTISSVRIPASSADVPRLTDLILACGCRPINLNAHFPWTSSSRPVHLIPAVLPMIARTKVDPSHGDRWQSLHGDSRRLNRRWNCELQSDSRRGQTMGRRNHRQSTRRR